MKVLISTQSPNPQISAFFAKSLAETYALGEKEGIEFRFMWSPDEFSFRNEAAEIVIEKNYDALIFIKPHIQWVATDLVGIIKGESLIEGVPTKQYFAPEQFYKAVLNDSPNQDSDSPITAKLMDLDMVVIKKEVFDRINDFVIKANYPKEDGIIEQIPIYFYSSTDENGPMSQDINYCKAAEKAEIPIVINKDMAIFEHVWVPYKTYIGNDIRKDFINKGFEEVEQL
jgi:hypothetical protein